MSNLKVNTLHPQDGDGLVQVESFLRAMGYGNAATIDTLATVPSDYNSLLFGPITITDTLVIKGTVKIKDIGDV